ncbi:hypothetical protein QVD17_06909 [Tagetes erecta]|uniref:C2H2-type domain-containing protein n=1 Tax=Tagetes erecta TaxID=13708 RepID=A0AAD8LMQ1_TARER|nr:hypothetical protein QVD17_06909 [Tagetes erecta]
MALLTFPFSSDQTQKVQPTKHNTSKRSQQNPKPKPKPKPKQQNSSSSSWDHFKNLLTCKQMDVVVVGSNKIHEEAKNPNGYSKLSSCSSLCSFRDVVHGNTRVGHRADHSPESSGIGMDFGLLGPKKQFYDGGSSSSGSKTLTGSMRSDGHGRYTSSSRAMQFRKISGCHECHTVDPLRYTIPRSTICVCSQCGEVFPKMDSLEHHQAVRHAVSELSPDDSGRNIVEIIFKSSWLKTDHPIFTIERILKVHNSRRTIQRFEDCRDTVKTRSTATRCAADGNELLRFHCTTITCSLGNRNTSTLCNTIPSCGVCTIIRHGFQSPKSGSGVRTTASSGRAHDCLSVAPYGRRAMLVCRVVAGKVKRAGESAGREEDGPYDSVAGAGGMYCDVEELYVFNPRAILPCFVVIYKAIQN